MAVALPFRFSTLGYPVRLIFIFILLNLGILLLAGFSVHHAYRQAQDRAELSASNLAIILEHTLNNLMLRVETSLYGLSSFYQAEDCALKPEHMNRQIEVVRQQLHEVEAIRVTDADGLLVYGTGVDASKKLSLADRPHFVRLKQQPELRLAISQPQKSRVNNQWVLAVAQRLTTTDGRFDGMIFATVTLDYFNRLFANIDVGPRGAISLRTDDFRFIARHPPLESIGLDVGYQYGSQILREQLGQGRSHGTFFTDQGLSQGKTLVHFRRVAEYPLIVALVLDEWDYLADWRFMSWRLAVLVLVLLFGSLVVEIALYRAWQRQQAQQHELARQKALYQGLVEEVPFFVMRHQADGRISFANRVFAAFFAKQQASLEGQSWWALLSESKQGDALKEGMLALTPEKPIGHGIQCLMYSSTFGERWIQWGWRGFFDDQGRLEYVQALGEDISERKRSRDIQEARLRLMDYSQGHSIDELLMAMLSEAERITGSQCALYCLLEADERSLNIQTWPSAATRHLAQIEQACRSYDLSQAGILADLLYQRQPILHNNQTQGTNSGGLFMGHVEIGRELLVPVVRTDKVVAALWLGNKPRAYGDDDLHRATALAEIAWRLVEKKRLEAQLLVLASTDPLTGLDNRRNFLGKLQHELERLKRFDILHASVLMLDLDHFKSINDNLGHAAGDAVLRHCAALMREDLRKIDSVGRLGGEEFAILLVGSDTEAAMVFAERLRATIADTACQYQGHSILVTISIGISALHGSDTQVDEVMNRADRALYRAKALGRNRCVLEGVGADPDKYNDCPDG